MEEIIDFINVDNLNGKTILINKTILEIQCILCKKLKDCYIYTEIINDKHIGIQLYKKKLYGLVKNNDNMIYIWKIK